MTGEVGALLHRRQALDRRRRRREGHRAGRSLHGQPRQRRRPSRSCAASSISASRCRFANSSIWLRTAAGAANGDRNNTRREFLLRRLRQQLRRRQVDQALPRATIRCPASTSTRSARFLRARDGRDGTCRRTSSSRWARRASTSTGCGRRSSSPGLWTDPGNSPLRKTYTSVGAQVDLHFNVLHWYDMTLSAGYARRATRDRSAPATSG